VTQERSRPCDDEPAATENVEFGVAGISAMESNASTDLNQILPDGSKLHLFTACRPCGASRIRATGTPTPVKDRCAGRSCGTSNALNQGWQHAS
jgi:hypothetical protein